ncbi:Sec-independent protein translocase protein TatB [Paraburkholderia sp. EG287A]|uniref:Sec-independent protein translocase protein TatB n=1 Tax=Paraburkholderia sp. EG287A TaxID=3237012 RepID=UPI0034D1981F
MLDFDVSKLAVIAAVALIVLGPERLPRLSRTVGTMLGRAKRYFDDVKAEVNSQIELEDVRKLKTDIEGAVKDLRSTVTGQAADFQAEARKLAASVQEALPVDYLPSIHDAAGAAGEAHGTSWSSFPAVHPVATVEPRVATSGRALRARTTPLTSEARANAARRSVARTNFASVKAGKRSTLRTSAARARQV